MDVVKLELHAGSWMDQANNVPLRPFAEVNLPPFSNEDFRFVDGLLPELHKAGLEPWETVTSRRYYFANASSESLLIVVAVYQSLGPALVRITLEEVARQIVSRILTWFPKPNWQAPSSVSLSEASQKAQDYFIYRDRLSPNEIEEIGAWTVEDGFEFVVRLKNSGERFYVKSSQDGLVQARVSLKELSLMRPH